jgi:zinc protease
MIKNVSADEVRQVARKHLRPEEAVIVVVGDRKKIEPGLEKLNLGSIEIRDSSGNP